MLKSPGRIGLVSLITLSVVASQCPPLFSGDDCSTIECLNGGYVKASQNFCTCPPGYLGIHCEAVKTQMPPDNHFKAGGSSFNIININLYTQYWGVRTYNNIQKGLADHFAAFPKYDGYNLLETKSIPYLDNTDQPVYNIQFDDVNTNVNFTLSDPKDSGLYWCYPVPIYSQLVKFIQSQNLRNTAITIITQHPPSEDMFEEARRTAVAFGIRINVFWTEDDTFNDCLDSQVNLFKTFVDITGGLFVKLQAEADDDKTKQLVAQVLQSHYQPQFVTIQSFPDCTTAQSMPVVIDPIVKGPYNFVFLGDTANPSQESFQQCFLRQPLRSFDKNLAIFQSPDPSCTSLSITANGPCTAIVFTNGDAAGPVNLQIFTSYVEDPSTDSSRYGIIENVPFYAGFHVEPPNSGSVVTVKSISFSNDSTWKPELVKRSPAAFEWLPNGTIACDASQTFSLYLNIQVDDANVQRAVRVACIATPPPPTTPAPDSTTVGVVTTQSPTTAETTTSWSSTTSGPDDCANNNGWNPATFVFAYAADCNLKNYALVQSTIVQAITSNQNNYTKLGNVLIDSTTATNDVITYKDNAQDFTLSCQQNSPNSTLKTDDIKDSDGLQAIRNFLSATKDDRPLENSLLVIIVNRLPKYNDDLTDDQYDQLTNMNVRVIPIISINSLAEKTASDGRSGAVYNRIAAQTNGHYIVANDAIGRDVNSDFNKIVGNVMQTAYAQNLLFTRNIGIGRVMNGNIGTLRVPTSTTGTVTVTITVTLSAVDTNVPNKPNSLLLGFKPNGDDTPSVSVDFLNQDQATSYTDSNFYTTTVNLTAGYDRELFLHYVPGTDQSDLLIRMWVVDLSHFHVGYIGFDELNGFNELSKVDEYTGAALRVKLYSDCYDGQKGTLLITDCNGQVSGKYDADQFVDGNHTFNDEGSYIHFPFVPFFCDNRPTNPTCVTGAESKYDAQFVTSGYSISRSFQCRPGVGSIAPNCQLKDANGNYQCSGTVPFKRGPTGKLNDCSNHGRLEFTATDDGDLIYMCICDDGYSGESCESVTCAQPNIDPLAIDNSYHTYTLVLGLESGSGMSLVLEDAQQFFALNDIPQLNNIWKYQLITYCADGNVEMAYSGGDLQEFQNTFNSQTLRACNANPAPGLIDLTTVYKTAVRGIGRNVKGVIAYYSEVSNLLNVTLDDFVQASQSYQQQVFVFGVDESDSADGLVKMEPSVAQAAMSTGGFLVQSWIDPAGTIKLDENFIPDLLKSSSSIAVYSAQQSSDFTFATEQTATTAYLVTWQVGSKLDTANTDLLRACDNLVDGTMVLCKLTGATSYTIRTTGITSPFYAAVYILDDVAPKAQIISDLAQDASNAVSTTSSDTRTMLSIYVPDGYTIVANSGDGGVTRNAQRTGCTFGWTAYSIFASEKYKQTGANSAQITLQKNGDSSVSYTRYFAFGTSSNPVCKNGGTAVSSTGSCKCASGFQGPDCSLVNCLQNSKSNAWADVCVCSAIDDAVCAKQYTIPSSFSSLFM